jgi:hypothetical protein
MSTTDKLLDWIEGSPAHVATAVVGMTLAVLAVLGLFGIVMVWLATVSTWLAIIIFGIAFIFCMWYLIYSIEKSAW